jgi:ribonucleoside-diphosphate reductase beta chain
MGKRQMKKRKLYDVTAPNRSTKIIEGKSSNVLNWDDVRFPWAYGLYKTMLGNFWTPFEIDMTQDRKQWEDTLSEEEKDTFLKIIGLLALLDSIQTDYAGRIADYITDSSVNALMIILAQQEVVHNHSYSYVLSSLVPKQKQDEVFEYWKTLPVLRKRNDFVAHGYEEFATNPSPESMLRSIVFDVILEGLFFYAGFAFFYDLARQGKMTASSQMINYINRDEHQHVRLFSEIFHAILMDFPALETPALKQFVIETFSKATELETEWSHFIIGNRFDNMDPDTMEEYLKFTANKRCIQLIGEKPYPDVTTNPMKWIRYFEDIDDSKQDFFEGKSRQYTKVDDDNGFDEL